MSARVIIKKLRAQGDPEIAAQTQRYFKTGPGEYGEGDQFIGLRTPQLRAMAAEYHQTPLAEIFVLLTSSWHEARLLAAFLLVARFKCADETEQQAIYTGYLAHTAYLNNWDIVDSSAAQIVGATCFRKDQKILLKLAGSQQLWERRIAVLATFYFIRREQFAMTLVLCEKLLQDPEDLMHKACGWMLREVGKRDQDLLCGFLDTHASAMPRTMLRYSLEKLPRELRQHYLKRR